MLGRSQVRHGDELKAAVENAEDFVALEIKALHIAGHLFVARGIAETQVAVCRVEGQQMVCNAFPVPGTKGTDGNRHLGFFTL